jgi:hypothetical protein
VSRRITVHPLVDTLVINGLEIDASILAAVIVPNNRLLWAFVRNGNTVQAVAYDEEKVIWLDLQQHVDR